MENLTCVIIDDDQEAAKILSNLLESYCPELTVLEIIHDSNAAEERCIELSPTFLFLDIEMPDRSGFDIAESLEEYDFYTIFYTTFSKYAIDAIKHNAFDYLLKPATADDILKTMARIKRSMRKAQELEENKANEENVITIKSGAHIRKVPSEDILTIDADGSYSKVRMKSGEDILVSKNLKSMSGMLTDHHFIRVHNSHIVNAREVEIWKLAENSCVLSNGEELRISVRRKEDVREYLTS